MERVKYWARLGAAKRIEEISAELEEIRRAFPELGGENVRHRSGGHASGIGSARDAAADSVLRSRRGRKDMPLAERREVSRRMRAYWAARRREKRAAQ